MPAVMQAGFAPKYQCSRDGMETTPGVVIFNLKTCSAEETDDEDVLDLHVGGTMSEPLVKPHPTQSSTWANFRRRLSSIPLLPRSYSENDTGKIELDPSVYDCSPKRNRNEMLIMASWVVLFPFYLAFLAMHEFPVDEEDKLNDALISGWYRLYKRQQTKLQSRTI